MDKDELEEVEDTGLEEQKTEETPARSEPDSIESSPSIEETSSSPQKSSSIITNLLMLWKKIPIAAKGTILTCLGYVTITIVIVIFILLLGAAATGVSEDLWENITNLNDSISTIGEKVGNFFTGEGFVTNQEEAEKYEKKYYEKLKQVADYYQRKLKVKIDTSMITATLFYGRGMSDYIDDDVNKHEDGLFVDDESDSDIYQGEAEFYKLARRQIKTLAKFQIVENTTFSTCPDIVSAPQSKTTPNSAKDIADTWAGFDSWNTRANFAYLPYEQKHFPTIDGTSRDIIWCAYKNSEDFLRQHYVDDYYIYKNYLDNYKSCVTECENLNGTQTWDPHTREWVTNTCNPETACATQKEKEQDYLSRLQNSWGDVFSVGDTPSENASFQCAHSSTWGTLSPYDSLLMDEDGFINRNYSFPEEWINSSTEPNFWSSALATLTGGMQKIDCSAKPSISTSYSIDIKDEGVYYFKLMSRKSSLLSNKSFIEKYYPDYITETDDEAQLEEELTEVVDGIFDLYDFIVEREETLLAYGNLCTSGITVIPGTNDSGYNKNPSQYPIGTFSFEEYIAMVVNGENNSGYDEAMKAQIIAARTYTLARTDGCTKPIRNSTEDQVARANPSDKIIQLVNETSGLVMLYNNDVFSAEYDSFKGSCSGGTCTGVYTKIPSNETHTIIYPSSFEKGIGGHGRGMSQVVANYMASQGKGYEEILRYFYADGIVISGISGGENGGLQTYPNMTYDNFDGITLVGWARRYIGNPYVFGGTSLTNGADCSGFIQSLVKELFGINIPRTSREQVNVGTPVSSLAEAQPGDLLFYKRAWSGGRIGHVAIYSGNGMQVHARSEKYGIMESAVNETPVAIRRLGG